MLCNNKIVISVVKRLTKLLFLTIVIYSEHFTTNTKYTPFLPAAVSPVDEMIFHGSCRAIKMGTSSEFRNVPIDRAFFSG